MAANVPNAPTTEYEPSIFHKAMNLLPSLWRCVTKTDKKPSTQVKDSQTPPVDRDTNQYRY